MTVTAPAVATTDPALGRRRGDFINVVRAELLKLWTVRSTLWTLLAVFAANIGFAVLAGGVIAPRLDAGARAHVDVVQLALAGIHLSQVACGVLGVLIVTGEYGSGMIRTTLAAIPRRRTLLAAKALVLTAVTLVAATASTMLAYLAFQASLPARTLAGTALTDPGVTRAVLGGGLYLTTLSLLGFGLGVLLRSSAAAIATVFGLLFVPPLLLQLLPQSWKDTIGPYIPMQSGNQVYIATHREASALGPWTGLGVFGIYVAVAVLSGLLLVNHRDAGGRA